MRGRMEAAAVTVWALALTLLLVTADVSRRSRAYGRDFYNVHLAAHDLLTHGNPYRHHPHVNPFAYPPSSALLLVPTAHLGARQAQLAGLVIAMVALVVLAISSAALAGFPAFGVLSGATLAALVVAVPSQIALLLGNMSATVAALLGVSLLLGRRGRWIAAGAVFGLALAVKPLVLPAALVFVGRRQWRALVSAAGVAGLLNVLAMPLMSDPLSFVTHRIPQLLRGQLLPDFANGSLKVVLSDAGAPGWLTTAARLAVVVIGVVTCVLVWRRAEPVRSVVLAAVPVLTVALVSGTDENHFVLVAVPMVLVLAASSNLLAEALIGVGTAVVSAPAVLTLAGRLHQGRQVALGQSLLLLGAFTAMVTTMKGQVRIGPAPSPEPAAATTQR